jgi:aspartate kinase
MDLTVAKFGGSAIGEMGASIPVIVDRIREMSDGAKVVAVFSAPLTREDGRRRSLTDVVLEQGGGAERGAEPDLAVVQETYHTILDLVVPELRDRCWNVVESHLNMAREALEEARRMRMFAGQVRARALGHSGELLMPHVMNHILQGEGLSAAAVPYDRWPIITDDNPEFTNFLVSEARRNMDHTFALLREHDIVCIGGFIGKTKDGTMTTYERGGTDRTAANMAILLHKDYNTSVDWEKDSSVVSADPRIVESGLTEVERLSYNEARLAGMFGMKILDPMAIKEIVDNGVDIPLRITDMGNPARTTTIQHATPRDDGHPIKIVTGKGNCAIMRMECPLLPRLLDSLENKRQYSEFSLLSPFTRDGTRFARILFTDGDFVRKNERYLLGFDPLASITYDRGAVTLIGDSMWRVQYVASKTCAKIGEAGLNILNVDAQEETSEILIIIEDSGDNLARAVRAVHDERPNITFI